MCGIAGIYNLTTGEPVPRERLVDMVEILRHRGPDAAGIYLDDHIGLGHTRLSIIDLSTGVQPICNEDQTLWIIYNGEVFNYQELREKLLSRGHCFTTMTDTEVILHMYEDFGSGMLEKLNGQFGFAIWDSKKRVLFLARDRCGIIPLYYTVHKKRLLFASEIKAFFTWPDLPRDYDPVSLDQVFTFWSTLPGRTAFSNVLELPPGHFMEVKNGGIETRRYWDLPVHGRDEMNNQPAGRIAEEVGELLEDSIRIRLRADVSVGSYLSGGIDSSGLTAIVRQNYNNHLKTFGITFEEKVFDESIYQKEMVRFLEVDHNEILATNEEIASNLSKVLWHCETPLLRTGPIPLFLLSRLVHEQGFKVVITGEGADEVFGGYNIFRETMLRAFWARQPGSKARTELIGKLYPYIFDDPRLKATLISFFTSGIDQPGHPLFSHLVRWNNTSKTKRFFSDQFRNSIGQYNPLDNLVELLPAYFHELDALSKAQYLEMFVFLNNYLLSSQGDRVAMANSVEVRPPYLDHRLIEYMARVPTHWKILGMNEKHILKKIYTGILPERIRVRAKNPYRAPVKQAIMSMGKERNDELLGRNAIEEAGIFDPDKVQKLVAKLEKIQKPGEVDNMALAGILTTQIIHRDLIAGSPLVHTASQMRFDHSVDQRSSGDH